MAWEQGYTFIYMFIWLSCSDRRSGSPQDSEWSRNHGCVL